MEKDLVKMSSKGQLVVPQDIRELEGFEPGDRFVPLAVDDGILFKRVKIPDVKAEFDKLAKYFQGEFKKKGITPKDVDEAVKWARKQK